MKKLFITFFCCLLCACSQNNVPQKIKQITASSKINKIVFASGVIALCGDNSLYGIIDPQNLLLQSSNQPSKDQKFIDIKYNNSDFFFLSSSGKVFKTQGSSLSEVPLSWDSIPSNPISFDPQNNIPSHFKENPSQVISSPSHIFTLSNGVVNVYAIK